MKDLAALRWQDWKEQALYVGQFSFSSVRFYHWHGTADQPWWDVS